MKTVNLQSPIVNPQSAIGQRDGWDGYVHRHQDATVFHTLSWRRTVESVFGHRAYYLTVQREGKIAGLLPLFLIKSRWVGRRLISLPYAVGGGILADDEQACAALYTQATQLAQELHCHSIDFRSERASISDLPIVDRYVGFRRELPGTPQEVLGWIPRKARAVVRHGLSKYNLQVDHGSQHLRRVWELYCLNMRRLSSLNYPFAFFERLIAETPGKHLVSLVRFNDEPIAGLVTLTFRDTVMPYFYGASATARRCGASHFVYYKLMEWACSAGYHIFDFGRSRRDNVGSFNFKRFFGFTPQPLGYQVHNVPGGTVPDLTPGNPRLRAIRRLWRYLPLWISRPAGAYVSRHIPG